MLYRQGGKAGHCIEPVLGKKAHFLSAANARLRCVARRRWDTGFFSRLRYMVCVWMIHLAVMVGSTTPLVEQGARRLTLTGGAISRLGPVVAWH
jgi:hypothetical protein